MTTKLCSVSALRGLAVGAMLFTLLLATGSAHAEQESFASTVLGCYHPGAAVTSVTYAHGRGHHLWTGWIKFREGHHDGFAMSFQMDTKTKNGETFYRVLPLEDDGSEPAASGCFLREWQRY